jgi:hypothetical protein
VTNNYKLVMPHGKRTIGPGVAYNEVGSGVAYNEVGWGGVYYIMTHKII